MPPIKLGSPIVRMLGTFALALGGCDGHLAELAGPITTSEDHARSSEGSISDGDPTFDADGGGLGGCNLAALMALPENGCANAGCHGPQFQGGLDLVSKGVEERLVGVASQTDACRGELLVDPAHPEQSLLLRMIDPARFGKAPCGVMMPLGSSEGVSPDTLACFERWVDAMANPVVDSPSTPERAFEAVQPTSYVNKVKTLLTGRAATSPEIERVASDPDALAQLIAAWVETSEFEAKLNEFLTVALQQRLDGSLDAQFMQLRGTKLLAFRKSLEQAFVRTAVDIVARDRPFHEILTTRTWQLSTAALAALSFLDQRQSALLAEKHTLVHGAGVDSVDARVWHVASAPASCEFFSPTPAADVMELMLGSVRCRGAGSHRFDDTLLTDADFEDFRSVELVPTTRPADVPRFYDVETLRTTTRLPLMQPRMGFFSSPAFLANWETNEDNQFRVTTSQALIVALGEIFSPADPTMPVRSDGLAKEHAAPATTCYGCHQFLDPMREYFARSYSFDYHRPELPGTTIPSFAFHGVVRDGGTLQAFASTLARHPDFATGWTQKLCYWASSQPCSERDPEFSRIAEVFRSSGYSFKRLLVELLSSPLVTGSRRTAIFGDEEPFVSITRRQHLCQLLDVRLGVEGACSMVRGVADLLPQDDFSRGTAEPVQVSVTGLFHYAAAEKLCLRLATKLVSSTGGRFSVSALEASLESLATDLMGIDAAHPRATEVRERLAAHFAAANAQTNELTALRSTFTVACMSPEVMAVGL